MRESTTNWFAAWKRNGFIRPESAQQWQESGFTPEEAAPWYHLDIVAPTEASKWKVFGLGPGDFVRWVSIECRTPEEVIEWRRKRIPFETAAQWFRAGIVDSEIVHRCIVSELSPLIWAQCAARIGRKGCVAWLSFSEQSDWLDSSTRDKWMLAGVLPSIAHSWIYIGLEPEESQALEEKGISSEYILSIEDHDEAKSRAQIGLKSRSADHFKFVVENFESADRELVVVSKIDNQIWATWRNFDGLKVSDVIEMVELGIRSIDFEKWQLLPGAYVETFIELIRSGMSVTESFAWKSNGFLESEILRLFRTIPLDQLIALRDCGLTIAQIEKLLKRSDSKSEINFFLSNDCPRDVQSSLIQLGISRDQIPAWWYMANARLYLIELWRKEEIELKEIDLTKRSSSRVFQLADAPLWKENGYSIKKALEMIRQGKSPYYPAVPAIDRFRKSPPANLPPVKSPPVKTHSVIVTPPGWISKYHSLATEEWYESIYSVAYYLQHSIRKGLSYDHFFENASEGFSIYIVMAGNRVSIVLRDLSGDREECRFDPGQLDEIGDIKSARKRLAMGLGLSWFIDWSVVCDGVDGQLGSTSFPIRPISGQTRYLSKAKYKYVGISTSRLTNSSEPTTNHASPIFHEVAGFVRELSDGRSPSEEARRRAPEHIRKRLKANQTWVRPHARGGAAQDIILRLRKTSLLSKALGTL